MKSAGRFIAPKSPPRGLEALLLAGKISTRRIRGGARSAQISCRETAKQRAVRIGGAGRPPGEWQRYARSPVHRRPSAPGRLSPGLDACATSRSTEDSFAESAAAT